MSRRPYRIARMDPPADGGVTEIEFRIPEAVHPMVEVSRRRACEVRLRAILPRGDGAYAEFFGVSHADAEGVVAGMAAETDARLLHREDRSPVVEVLVDASAPAVFLSRSGALLRAVSAVRGTGRAVAQIPPSEDAGTVVARFLDEYPRAELAAKRDLDRFVPVLEDDRCVRAVGDALTDRQLEVLAAAHRAGYFEWPREETGEELAARLDVSAATMHKHLRIAERKLVEGFFDVTGGP